VNSELTIGVSSSTYERLDLRFGQGVRIIPITAACDGFDTKVDVLWRRQADRTAWLVEALEVCCGVRWVHTDTAGVDRLPLDDLRSRGVLLTNARGVYTASVSEWAVGAILMAGKRLDGLVRNSDARRWHEPPGMRELASKNLVIVGLGSIGTAIARVTHALNMNIVGVVRRPFHNLNDERLAHVDTMVSVTGDWQRYLEDAAYVVICAPLTHETEGLFGAETLGRIADGAWLINVSRGKIVNESALCTALDNGRLAGAILDSFVEEPLPANHPFGGRANVIVSPHVSSRGDQSDHRSIEHFLRELRRYQAGIPLMSRVDYDAGY
jgi:phosphoglycerate dehydrogenase-like enzyme